MTESSGTGGSAAAQAYRAEVERQGIVLAPLPQAAVPTGAPKDGRAVERKRIGGRARVVRTGAQPVIGKMYDISETGACIVLDGMLPSKSACMLEFEIFHNGQRHVFSTQALVVYGIFSSGKGFKVGFQFGPRSPEASKSIAALVA